MQSSLQPLPQLDAKFLGFIPLGNLPQQSDYFLQDPPTGHDPTSCAPGFAAGE